MIYLFLIAIFFNNVSFASATDSSSIADGNIQEAHIVREPGLRMGFNQGTHEISILFPKEHSLKYFHTEEGKQIYHSHEPYQDQFVSYQFAYQGFLVDSFLSFKQNYLASIEESLRKKNPKAESKISLEEKRSPDRQRTIIEQVTETGKRTIFVADFIAIENHIYLISEMIEASQNNSRETAQLIDEAFFESINLSH